MATRFPHTTYCCSTRLHKPTHACMELLSGWLLSRCSRRPYLFPSVVLHPQQTHRPSCPYSCLSHSVTRLFPSPSSVHVAVFVRARFFVSLPDPWRPPPTMGFVSLFLRLRARSDEPLTTEETEGINTSSFSLVVSPLWRCLFWSG